MQTGWHPVIETDPETGREVENPQVVGCFYDGKKLDGRRSREEGEDVFRDATFFIRKAVGSRDTSPPYELKAKNVDYWARVCPKAWAEYQASEAQPIDGTELTELDGMTAERATKLTWEGVRTIEQLAQVDDSVIERGITTRRQVKAANDYVKARQAEAGQTEKRGPGRPRKQQQKEAEGVS